VMLGAGFFATGEAQKVVHAGSQQASSSLEIIGNIYGETLATTADSTASAHLQSLTFTVGNTAGGTPIDISQMLVTFVCGEKSVVIPYDKTKSFVKPNLEEEPTLTANSWAVIKTYNDVGGKENRNHLLESGEQFVLQIVFSDSDAKALKPNTPFSVNLQPAIGAAYPIKKTVPANLYAVNILN